MCPAGPGVFLQTREKCMSELKWLGAYAGQTIDELLGLEGEYRTDSLVLAFEQALDRKAALHGAGALSGEEHLILAIEALEREVNNGGYSQFFINAFDFVPTIVQALERIGCLKTAQITQKAIAALNVPDLTLEAVEMALDAGESDDAFNMCDESYHKTGEDITGCLFAFIRSNRDSISF
jgi:hypothetical protein